MVGFACTCWHVEVVDKDDLSVSRYKEIEHKEIEYEKPGIIMDGLMALEREIGKDVEGIKKMIQPQPSG